MIRRLAKAAATDLADAIGELVGALVFASMRRAEKRGRR